jgi:hypothetical protein
MLLTQQHFEPYLNNVFQLIIPTSTMAINFTLTEITPSKYDMPNQQRQGFSLFFHAPVLLNQGIYQLDHSAFTDLALFLVPIAEKKENEQTYFIYQAVFN